VAFNACTASKHGLVGLMRTLGWLVSDGARNVTGVTLPVDAGMAL